MPGSSRLLRAGLGLDLGLRRSFDVSILADLAKHVLLERPVAGPEVLGQAHRTQRGGAAQIAFADVLLLNNVNPVYALPGSGSLAASLAAESVFVVAFSNFMDDTTALADLVLPAPSYLERQDPISAFLASSACSDAAASSPAGAGSP